MVDIDADLSIETCWDYTYNYDNRQTLVEKDSSEVGQYIYNVLGNRVSREVNHLLLLKGGRQNRDMVVKKRQT